LTEKEANSTACIVSSLLRLKVYILYIQSFRMMSLQRGWHIFKKEFLFKCSTVFTPFYSRICNSMGHCLISCRTHIPETVGESENRNSELRVIYCWHHVVEHHSDLKRVLQETLMSFLFASLDKSWTVYTVCVRIAAYF